MWEGLAASYLHRRASGAAALPAGDAGAVPVSWGAAQTRVVAGLAEGAPFHMAIGRLEAADEAELLAYLEFLGSRLVFLIDWNRARKSLRGFLRGPDRVAVLEWAAAQEVGHRGFLELGGARLINQAIEAASGGGDAFRRPAMRRGGRCGGRASWCASSLRTASEGLRARNRRG